MVEWVLDNDDAIIVESRGAPTVVIIPFSEYENVEQARLQARRREALETMRRLRERVRSRTQDLTEEMAEELANRVSRDAVDHAVESGRLQFED